MRLRYVCLLVLGLAAVSARSAVAPAYAPDDVQARAAKYVSGFLDVFSDVKCTEQVEQEKLSKKGKVEYAERSRFDYLLMAQATDGELSLEESRLEEGATEHRKNVSLLVTNGFASLLLIFHPYYNDSFEFSPDEGPPPADPRWAKVNFRYKTGKRTPMVLLLRGREYPLALTGTAWIDRETGVIQRIQAELQSSMEDVGLQALRADVTYAPVRFSESESLWLPAQARIEVDTLRQHWRNVHQFTHYAQFGVTTEHADKPPGATQP